MAAARPADLPTVGDRLSSDELADSIELLARRPRGALPRRRSRSARSTLLRAGGAAFSGDEWVLAGDVPAEDAISAPYGDVTVHQTPPPSPGWMLLQQAGLLDGLLTGLPTAGAESVHLLAHGGPPGLPGPVRALRLRQRRLARPARRRRAGARPRVSSWTGADDVVGAPTGIAGDTTSCVAVDADGRAVSAISSLAFTFGARISIPGTGIALNNRLARGAYLLPGHPNALAPRRKPLHTLNAWIATDGAGRLRHVGNTPGGDGQVQWNMQLLSHLVDGGLDPQEAVSAPRTTVHPGSDADALGTPETLQCE